MQNLSVARQHNGQKFNVLKKSISVQTDIIPINNVPARKQPAIKKKMVTMDQGIQTDLIETKVAAYAALEKDRKHANMMEYVEFLHREQRLFVENYA